jgi:hypothetical protein
MRIHTHTHTTQIYIHAHVQLPETTQLCVVNYASLVATNCASHGAHAHTHTHTHKCNSARMHTHTHTHTHTHAHSHTHTVAGDNAAVHSQLRLIGGHERGAHAHSSGAKQDAARNGPAPVYFFGRSLNFFWTLLEMGLRRLPPPLCVCVCVCVCVCMYTPNTKKNSHVGCRCTVCECFMWEL